MSASPLFSKYDVFTVVTSNLHDRVKKEVDSLKSDEVLGADASELLDVVYARMEMSIPILQDDAIHFDQKEIQVDARRFADNRMFFDDGRPHFVPGTRIRVLIPFEGDRDVFHVHPSTWSSAGFPVAEVLRNEIVLTYQQEKPDGAAIKERYLATLAEIRNYLANIDQHFAGFNQQIRPIIQAQIKVRKEKLIAATSIGDALGLPQRGADAKPATYSISLKKREKPRINIPASTAQAKAEPVLSQNDYEYVLRIMRLMTQSMERAPKSFESMDEEAIRDNFLVHINAQYEGMASGEAFNFGGKTDILLKVDGTCVFIAECKFWTGEKGLLETIDQILSYLSWRDTKVAVVILNRNKQFTPVLKSIEAVVPTHDCFVEARGIEDETTFRFEFHQPNDNQRRLQLTVVAFDVPYKK